MILYLLFALPANGLRYPRWGGTPSDWENAEA
jgi:hypothetical protein